MPPFQATRKQGHRKQGSGHGITCYFTCAKAVYTDCYSLHRRLITVSCTDITTSFCMSMPSAAAIPCSAHHLLLCPSSSAQR